MLHWPMVGHALIRVALKQARFRQMTNYRPVSNLTLILKIVEGQLLCC